MPGNPRSRVRVTPRSSQTRAARNALQQAAVMADQHDARTHSGQFALQPFDTREVEMVGRLVEQQDVGRGRQCAGERGAARLAAGQRRRIFLAAEAELLEQVQCTVTARGQVISGRVRVKPRLDIGQRRGEARTGRVPAASSGSSLRAGRSGRPASGCNKPAAIRSKVDLPEPLRPTRQTRSPAATASPAPASSGVVPKVRLMS